MLRQPAVRKIAIANPEHSPYGRAAVAVLQHSQIYAEACFFEEASTGKSADATRV